MRTISDVYLKRACSLDASASSALWFLTKIALYKSTYLLTSDISMNILETYSR